MKMPLIWPHVQCGAIAFCDNSTLVLFNMEMGLCEEETYARVLREKGDCDTGCPQHYKSKNLEQVVFLVAKMHSQMNCYGGNKNLSKMS